jgi:hypothetical protein
VKFNIFKDGKAVEEFPLCGAYLFGNDSIAIRHAEITFKDGGIECGKPNMETSGLALLWPVEEFGKVLLPTTCLPERDKPYNLNVEIARAKLMQIINKREDWAFFDGMEKASTVIREAEELFIKAIHNISDSSTASRLADESLKKSIVFSEKLAIKQAETLFELRGKNHAFGRGCLGCRIDPEQIRNPKYIDKLVSLFNFVTIPINWSKIEIEKDYYDFSEIDNCLNILSRKRLAVAAGPLICFSEEYLPKWLLNTKPSFEKIREAAYQFVLNVVSRYAGKIRVWRVISGLNVFNYFGFSFEQILEITRAVNMAVKAASDRCLKIIEVSNPWGEYYSSMPNSIPPLVYMDMVIQGGINFEAFGLQVRFGKGQAGMHVRDMLQISAVLDTFGSIAKPLYITEVEVPSVTKESLNEPETAGVWHKKWDHTGQGQWIEQFYRIAFSKPFVDTVTYSHLADMENSAMPQSGLLTEQFEEKKSFRALMKLREYIFER